MAKRSSALELVTLILATFTGGTNTVIFAV